MQDTIVALATAAGAGAIAVIRVSGSSARNIARCVYRGRLEDHELRVGTLLDSKGMRIDRGMAVMMYAPHSYTGEDVLELHCHGGVIVISEVITACIQAGARPAQPGEFTRRAYLNGRMDLSQSQAVMDLISAGSILAARASLDRMNGGLSRRIKALEGALLSVAAYLTATLEYPDEDLEPIVTQNVRDNLEPIIKQLRDAIACAPIGRKLLNGVRVTIVGTPNAGKSSLLNALLDSERAIVTDIPGTTRDTLTEAIQVEGIALLLTDTAGLRDSADPIERHGVDKAYAAIESADVLLLCVDASDPFPEEICRYLDDPRTLMVLNKLDLPPQLSPADFNSSLHCVSVSTLTGDGIAELRAALRDKAVIAMPGDTLLIHENDLVAAQDALEALRRADAAMLALSLDCALLDIEIALRALRGITDSRDEAVLDKMFSTFCLGK